ncbi:MAG TPA: tetratricopeptide repeat protein [Kiritimatiellia bacterium]|nr:tetratricopeptide repeat protein [Kiritimatiellia bacterium]
MMENLNSGDNSGKAMDGYRNVLLAMLLTAVTLAVYYPVFSAGFIWDDDVHFTANDAVRRWKGIFDIWTTRSAAYYPLVLTTGWALHKMVGFNPAVFHTVTLLLHVANALLLVAILRRFDIRGAWFAGFLFALHPIQVESVAWVSELKNTQSAFFLFLSVLYLQRAGFFSHSILSGNTQRIWYWGAVVLFILAILSKTSVVMAPVVLVALVWWKRGIRRWMDVDGLFPFFIVAVLASGWTVWEQRYNSGAHGFEWSLSIFERIALAGQVFWFYIGKLAWPFNQMFIYPRWNPASSIMSYLPFLLAVACGIILWLKRQSRGRVPGLILFGYAAMLFPVMGFFNVYFMRYSWVADHFVYLPAIFWFAGAGLILAWLDSKQRMIAMVLACLVVTTLGYHSHRHVRTFHDQESLWRAAISSNPTAWMAYNNLGSILRARGDRDGARALYEKALSVNARHYEALNNLGILALDEQKPKIALPYFDQAIEYRPDLYLAWINRGIAMEKLEDFVEAERSYRRASEINPKIDGPLVYIAMLAERTGNIKKAIGVYRQLLSRHKLSDAEVGAFLFERAFHIKQTGKVDEALEMLDEAAQLVPSLPDIYLLQGQLREQKNLHDQAIKSYRRAVSHRPDWGAALIRLARLLSAHPDPDKRNATEALFIIEGMLSISDGKVAEIFDVYAMALAASGRYGDAMKSQLQAMQLVSDPAIRDEMGSRLQLYELGETYSIRP